MFETGNAGRISYLLNTAIERTWTAEFDSADVIEILKALLAIGNFIPVVKFISK